MNYQAGFAAPTPYVTQFLILIIAPYLVFALFGETQTGSMLYNFLTLDPSSTLYKFELWRIVSYAFLHDPSSPFHVIFNALLLYMVGGPLEELWGEKRFVIFMLSAIVLGGLMVLLSYALGISNASVVGFSSATMALIIAWGLSFREQQIYIFGLLPLTGLQLVYVTVGLEVVYAVSSNAISSAAHFGGILTGLVFCLGFFKAGSNKLRKQ